MEHSLISPLPWCLLKLLRLPQNNTPGFSWSASCSAPASPYSGIPNAVKVSFKTCELDHVTLLFKRIFTLLLHLGKTLVFDKSSSRHTSPLHPSTTFLSR